MYMKRLLDHEIKKHGFVKVKSEWQKSFPELTILLYWQKSNFSPEYYINVGLIVNKFMEEGKEPSFHDGQLRARIQAISTLEERPALNEFLANYKEIEDEHIVKEKISSLVIPPILRFVENSSTIEGLADFIATKFPGLLTFASPRLKEVFKKG